jgi:uncharacterized membrane protein YidH (DUF202 family)
VALVVPRDPGLQVERTALAWWRTAFLLLANSVLIVRGGFEHRNLTLVGLGVLLLGTTAIACLVGARRHRDLLVAQADSTDSRAINALVPMCLSGVATVCSASAIAVIVWR